MNKMLVFDMDGTIADLYGVENWLEKIHNSDASLYRDAKPLYNMDELNTLLQAFQLTGWKIAVTSWLAKDSTKEYDKEVRKAKREWLEKYNFPFDEIHLVKYGTKKSTCTKKKSDFQVLIDDNEEVRKSWNLGLTINANNDIITVLRDLLEIS